MPKEISNASPEVHAIMQAVLDEHHPDLQEAGVQVGVIFIKAARYANGEPKGNAITSQGDPCAAVIKTTSAKQRLKMATKLDAIIEVDEDRWDEFNDDQRSALFDHELTHLEVKCDKRGAIAITDDLRPKLRRRGHDAAIGIFKAVVERHGHNSIEHRQVKALWDGCQGLLFDFARKQLGGK